MKKCFKCGVPKPLGEFYCHPKMADGLLGKCKECTRADVSQNRSSKALKVSDYEHKRNRTPERRAKKAGYQRRHRELHPDRYKARSAVHRAIRGGRLKREPCVYCGSVKSQAHHRDYSKPLEVVWACFRCHRAEEHGQIVT